jgi:glycosyltransferase involved in cell wall biosynthesis
MNDQIIVSVIIPNFNYGHYINECVESVINSDFDHSKFEIVIIDDASTDNSRELISKLKKDSTVQITLIKNRVNLGLAKSRNKGIRKAKGNYLFFLDSDNYIEKECLKRHYEFLKKNSENVACYAPIQKFDDITKENLEVLSNSQFDFSRLLKGNYIDAMAMIKKPDIINAGLYDEQMPISGWEDYELWLKLGINNKQVSIIPGDPQSFYRSHKSSMINNIANENYTLLKKYLNKKYKLNFQEFELKNELLIPLNDITAQVFYNNRNVNFSENKVISQSIKLTNEPNQFFFELPISKESTSFLRFDICQKIGLVNIHDIEIKDNNNNSIFVWDKHSINLNNSSFLFKNEELWPEKIVQFSVSDDPHFVLATNKIVEGKCNERLIVSVTLSSLENKQVQLLNNMVSPLSFGNQIKSEENKHKVKLLENEIVKLSTNVSYNKEIKVELKQNLATKQQHIEQLIKDKSFLIEEGKEKNKSVNKALKSIDSVTNINKEVNQKLIQSKETFNQMSIEIERLNGINKLTKETNTSLQTELNKNSASNINLVKELNKVKEAFNSKSIELEKLTIINELSNETNLRVQGELVYVNESNIALEKEISNKKAIEFERLKEINRLTNDKNLLLKKGQEETFEINRNLVADLINEKEVTKKMLKEIEELLEKNELSKEINNTQEGQYEEATIIIEDLRSKIDLFELTIVKNNGQIENSKNVNESILYLLEDHKKKYDDLCSHMNEILKDFANIKNSKSWKYTEFVRAINAFFIR